MKPAIIIGGPPSSGSSLLLDLLGRHSSIAAFSETHLLAKPALWIDWANNRKLLFEDTLKSPDWFMHTGIDMISIEELKLVSFTSVNSPLEYCSQLFTRLAQSKGKTNWCEKTPANVYFFHLYPDAHAYRILTVRNPYDIIASLIFRNVPIVDAVCRTLLNLGIGHLQYLKNSVHIVKYESLVSSPKLTFRTLLDELNIAFEDSIFEDRSGKIKMDGWKNFEDGEIKSNSIGRFKELSLRQQSQVKFLSDKLSINEVHLKEYEIEVPDNEVISIPNLAKAFGYDIPSIEYSSINTNRHFFIDKYKRKFKGYPSYKPYPVKL